MGTNYVANYRPLIDKWFALVLEDKERRMSPAVMVKTIRAMFPNNYDIPSEQHVRNAINYRFKKARKEKEKVEEQAKKDKAKA